MGSDIIPRGGVEPFDAAAVVLCGIAAMEETRIDVPDDATVEVIRGLKPWQRLAAVFDLNRTARRRLAGYFRTRHPEWTDEQVAAAVAERMSRGAG